MNNKASSLQILIPRRAACCAQCQEPFNSGEDYYSILKEGEEEGSYLRSDYCLTCWPPIQKHFSSKEACGVWKSMIPLKKESSDLPKQRDARALHLLKEALTRQEPAEAEAFVLALYLARRRKLILRQEIKIEKGKSALVYEVAETEEMVCVSKLGLSQLQVDKLQLELAKKFQL